MKINTYEFFTETFSHLIQAETMAVAFQKYAEWADDPEDMDIIAIIEHDRGYNEFIAGNELDKPSKIVVE